MLGIIKAYGIGTIIGTKSAGCNGNKNSFMLSGGYRISFTGMKVLNHDKSQLHTLGIKPDILLNHFDNFVNYEKSDLLLLKALEFVNNNSNH